MGKKSGKRSKAKGAQKTDLVPKNIPELPTELLEQIFQRAERGALASVCLSNKRFHDIATPVLYGDIDLSDIHEDVIRIKRPQQLCRTLGANLTLRQHVKELNYYVDAATGAHMKTPRVSGVGKAHFEALLQNDLHLPHVVKVMEEVLDVLDEEHLPDEAYLCLLLALCPNIHTLAFEGKLGGIMNLTLLDDVLDYMQEHQPASARSAEPCGLYSIVRVELHNDGVREHDNEAFSAPSVDFMMRFPSLESISAYHVVEADFHSESKCLDRHNRLKELNMTYTFGDASDIEFLLEQCPSLRSLTVQWAMREKNYRRYDWAHLGDALRKHCTQLEHLRLDHEHDTMMDDENLREFAGGMDSYDKRTRLSGLGSLQSLSQLKTLYLSKIALYGTHGGDTLDMDEDDDDDSNDFNDSGGESGGYDSDGGQSRQREDRRTVHTLETLLPASLRELTILCEDTHLDPSEKALVNNPRAASLDNITIFGCQKDRWISKNYGEHPKPQQRVARSPPARSIPSIGDYLDAAGIPREGREEFEYLLSLAISDDAWSRINKNPPHVVMAMLSAAVKAGVDDNPYLKRGPPPQQRLPEH